MKTNVKAKSTPEVNHEGVKGFEEPDNLNKLSRAVATCLLGEDTFYKSGSEIKASINTLAHKVKVEDLATMAETARNVWNLRHAPLFLCKILASRARGRADNLTSKTLYNVIQRADELSEFLAIYWEDGKKPLSKQIKKGLAAAFTKFDAYQLAKYNRDAKVKLRDVLFMVHAKPNSKEQAEVWKQLVDGTLSPPDTWEVALSGGEPPVKAFTRLLENKKLPYMALLRNLRNMTEAGVCRKLVSNAILEGAEKARVLPFRYIAASNTAPSYASVLDDAMKLAAAKYDKIEGETVVLVDVSGSMNCPLSAKSDLTRMSAASALALLTCLCGTDTRVFSFSDHLVEVPCSKSLGLISSIKNSQPNYGTALGHSLRVLKETLTSRPKRIIIITDEQSTDSVRVGDMAEFTYIINVCPYGVGLDADPKVCRINGFSESFLTWMAVHESQSK